MAVTQTTDTCTNNHCVWSEVFPKRGGNWTLSEGNRKATYSSSTDCGCPGSIGVSGAGTWYFEITASSSYTLAGIVSSAAVSSSDLASSTPGNGFSDLGGVAYGYYANNGYKLGGPSNTYASYGATFANTDVIGVAFDAANGTLTFYKNGSTQGQAFTGISTSETWFPFVHTWTNEPGVLLNNGQTAFAHTPPTGYVGINTTNLFEASAPAIEDGSVYFNTSTWEGNGGTRRFGPLQPLTETYSVGKSLLFEDGDSAYLNKTFGSDGDKQKMTFSWWMKRGNLGITDCRIFTARDSNDDQINFRDGSDYNRLDVFFDGTGGGRVTTKRIFKDTTQWVHCVVAIDTTQSTAGNRVRIYVNGIEETEFDPETQPAENKSLNGFNNDSAHAIGARAWSGAAGFYDGYLAEIVFIDGQQLTPTSFGQVDTTTNLWIPKDISGLTTDDFGSNGYYLDMAVAPGTGNGPGNDVSGNNNDFTVNNFSAGDQSSDTPTNNFAVITSLEIGGNGGTATMSEGNLKVVQGGGGGLNMFGSIPISSGKWHYEVTLTNREDQFGMGIIPLKHVNGNTNQFFNHGIGAQLGGTNDGKVFDGNTHTDASTHATTINKGAAADGNTLACEIDLDNAQLEWFNNSGVSLGTYSFIKEVLDDGQYLPCIHINDNGTFVANFGQNTFTHTPTTGFSAISQDNLPATTSSVSDFTWIKNRDATDSHMLFDSVRGIQKDIHSNTTDIQVTDNPNTLTRFLQAGAELSNDVQVNTDGESYVAWNWAAGGAPTTDNISNSGSPGQTPTNGSVFRDGAASTTAFGSANIYPTRASINTTAGISIIAFESNDAGAGTTVAHGLDTVGAPSVVMQHNLDSTDNWYVLHTGLTAGSGNTGNNIYLDITNAVDDNIVWWNRTNPSSSVVTLGAGNGSGSGPNEPANESRIMYCFVEIPGYSAFGNYEGNNDSSDGTIIHLGFKPAFFMAKNADTTGAWLMFDSTREPSNLVDLPLEADDSKAEAASGGRVCDFLSSGVKIRGNSSYLGSAHTFIYMAFAEHPFAGTAPITAV